MAVPRLKTDLVAIVRIFESETPIMVPVRPTHVVQLVYGFGDASGEGYGSAWVKDPTDRVRLRRGFWCTKVAERSSNYRELRNLVEAIKELHESVGLEGCEVWMFTDNKVAQMVYHKGNSDDRLLFDLT